jgi:hypothetical protein
LDIEEELPSDEKENSQMPWVRKKTVTRNKTNIAEPYQVQKLDQEPPKETMTFGMDVDDYIESRRKIEERLKENKKKNGEKKVAVALDAKERKTFDQKVINQDNFLSNERFSVGLSQFKDKIYKKVKKFGYHLKLKHQNKNLF